MMLVSREQGFNIIFQVKDLEVLVWVVLLKSFNLTIDQVSKPFEAGPCYVLHMCLL